MKTNASASASKPFLTIRFHLTDGSVHSFVQTDDVVARKIWESVDPARLFAHPRIVIGSDHSKAVFVSAETIRVDFLQDSFQCWEFPGGYSDIVELSEEEFREHARLDQLGTGGPKDSGKNNFVFWSRITLIRCLRRSRRRREAPLSQ